MSTTSSPTSPLRTSRDRAPVLSQIDAADIEAARQFLLAGEEAPRARPPQVRTHAPSAGPKAPTVSHGITRARHRADRARN